MKKYGEKILFSKCVIAKCGAEIVKSSAHLSGAFNVDYVWLIVSRSNSFPRMIRLRAVFGLSCSF